MSLFQVTNITKYNIAPHWKLPLLCLCAAYVGIFVLYSGTLSTIVDKWVNSDTYAHGVLVVPLSIYMIWTKISHLSRMAPRPSLWASAILLFSVVVWLFGTVINVLVIQQLAVLAMIWAIVYFILGAQIVKK